MGEPVTEEMMRAAIERFGRHVARDFALGVDEHGIKNACPRLLSADGRSYLCLSESEHFALRGDPGNVGHRLEVTQNHREYDGALDPWEADHATE